MAEPLLTKRLHVSGLTPSLTPADLERRLSSFGKVKAMDGFGARDALGDSRKFGFVTIEISAKGLEKCLNVLSGTTWKGAKLRIGEAKPDFRERLAQIAAQPPRPVRPKRTRARDCGYLSSTIPLTPLSTAAAGSTPGWIVTPSGRVVRPMRMRPERPLEPMRSELGTSKVKSGKVKKRVKPPPVRARRRLIDPIKWDSVYLKGAFLDNVPVPLPASKDAPEPSSPVKHDIADEEGEEETEEDVINSDVSSSIVRQEVVQSTQPQPISHDRACPMLSTQQPQGAALTISSQIQESINVREEASTALAILSRMFEGKEDWDGRESVDEVEDLGDNETREDNMHVDKEDDIEVVPRDLGEDVGSRVSKDKGKGKEKSSGEVGRLDHKNGVDIEAADDRNVEMEEIGPSISIEASTQAVMSVPRTNLEALFALTEQASFSLLDHLDLELDLELDADILGIGVPSGTSQRNLPQSEAVLPTSHVVEIPAATSTTKPRSRVTLDASQPLLFPLLDSLPHPRNSLSNTRTMSHQGGAPTCFLFPSATRIRGLHPLPPSITFSRSPQDTTESIRERWERDKSSLTHEWKKTWREARGNKRGRTGTGGEVGGGY